MKRYHVSGRPNGLPAGGEESPSKLAKNRERIAAANARRAKPKTKRQYGISAEPGLKTRLPDRSEKPVDETYYLAHASKATRAIVAAKVRRQEPK
jgi:hypothetical protein